MREIHGQGGRGVRVAMGLSERPPKPHQGARRFFLENSPCGGVNYRLNRLGLTRPNRNMECVMRALSIGVLVFNLSVPLTQSISAAESRNTSVLDRYVALVAPTKSNSQSPIVKVGSCSTSCSNGSSSNNCPPASRVPAIVTVGATRSVDHANNPNCTPLIGGTTKQVYVPLRYLGLI
jgi:hypothetical protein